MVPLHFVFTLCHRKNHASVQPRRQLFRQTRARHECSDSKDGISAFRNASRSRGSEEHGCGGYEAGDEARTGACAFEKAGRIWVLFSIHLSQPERITSSGCETSAWELTGKIQDEDVRLPVALALRSSRKPTIFFLGEREVSINELLFPKDTKKVVLSSPRTPRI